MAFYVYMLRCADGSYYTGHTDCLEKRVAQHHSGEISSCYTFKRRPLTLVFSEFFYSRVEAITAERQIKGWGRLKKEAMLRGDWAEVSRLASSRAAPTDKADREVCVERGGLSTGFLRPAQDEPGS